MFKSILMILSLVSATSAFAAPALSDYSANSQEERIANGNDDSKAIAADLANCSWCRSGSPDLNAHEPLKQEATNGHTAVIYGKDGKAMGPADAAQ